jgi:hypothetical protein
MRATGHAGALLLFDISGFFDNINPGRAIHILHNKGFPTNVCDWAMSFLTGRTASLKIGTYESSPFPILNRMPQGSPLSPILSTLYTSSLIEASERWTHCDLSMYMDDGAIYAVSATTTAVASKARHYYMKVLKWLDDNGLQADPSKMELMMFRPTRANPNLIGAEVLGARYTDPNLGPNHITIVSHLRYLGVYIDHRLDWTRHVTIMANRTRSNIWGINILGNSVRGLDFLNWRKVYNALIIPGLTYGAQVWYTGVKQKGLIQKLQVAQNDRLRKIAGVFKMTPVEPLHNLTGVPPISYVLNKLKHSYSLKLQGTAPNAKTRTILYQDQCQYWPDYVRPITDLSLSFIKPAESTYRPFGTADARPWGKPRFTYLPTPPPHILASHKRHLREWDFHSLHIIVSPFIRDTRPVTIFQCSFGGKTILTGCTKGIDYTQAICRAVYDALTRSLPSHDGPVLLWLRPKTIPDKILTITPHRDSHVTFDIRQLITSYLTDHELASVDFIAYQRRWPGTPTRMELREQADLWSAQAEIADTPNNGPEIADTPNNGHDGHVTLLDNDTPPKQVTWEQILMDYTPSNHPSHIAYVPPEGNKPPPGIQGTIAMRHRLVTSTLFRLAIAHCFDADYSDRFHPNANDITICPCSSNPRSAHRPRRHTRQHIIFNCVDHIAARVKFIRGLSSLKQILQSKEFTVHLGNFLLETNSTLLRPLPKPLPVLHLGRDPPL